MRRRHSVARRIISDVAFNVAAQRAHWLSVTVS
jgi:hypothetical protein